MTYVDGFVLAVPTAKLDAYFEMASAACKIWMDLGALEYKECVAEDVDDDKGFCATFPASFGAKSDETMVFAYVVYKSREHRDEVNAKIHTDPRMKDMPKEMPFDMKRMCYGGFKTVVTS